MNMFDARLDQKYARVRVTNGLNGINLTFNYLLKI
jgi:hypothetical protein